MLRKLNKPLFLIILLGLVLRLYGITHGFPFIYHVDEPALIRSSYNIRFNPNPEHFDWPHFHFYLNFFLYFVVYLIRGAFQVFGLKSLVSQVFPLLWRDPLIFYFISRVFDAFLGAFTAIPIFLIGKKLFGVKAGLLSALVITVLPYHVHSSHYALIDVPMTFWFSWSVYFSTLIMFEGKKKWYVLAGIFAGLSASTKYNGGFSVFIIAFAHVIYTYSNKLVTFVKKRVKLSSDFWKQKKLLLVAALFSLLAFFIGTPFAVLDFDTFSRSDGPKGAFWQFENVGKVDSLREYFSQLELALTTKFDTDFGFTILVLFEVYFLYFLFSKKTKEKTFIAIPGFFYFLYITSFGKNRAHYYMLIYPFIASMVGSLLIVLEGKISKQIKDSKNSVFVFSFVLALVFIPPLYFSLKDSIYLAQKDTRNLAFEWLSVNTTKNDLVLYSGNDLEQIMNGSTFKAKKISSLLGLTTRADAKFLVVSVQESIHEKESFDEIENRVVQVNLIKPVDRPGPTIYVYSIIEKAK